MTDQSNQPPPDVRSEVARPVILILNRDLSFGPHKDVDGFRAAKRGGATRVVSNGDFHRDMTGFVRRYARPAAEPAPGDGRTSVQTDVAENTVP